MDFAEFLNLVALKKNPRQFMTALDPTMGLEYRNYSNDNVSQRQCCFFKKKGTTFHNNYIN